MRKVLALGAATGRLTHVERLPAAAGPPGRVARLDAGGARDGVRPGGDPGAVGASGRKRPTSPGPGENVIMATGTASGKSVGYLAPALTAIMAGATALYLAPTRALAADQLGLVRSLGADLGPPLRAAVVDSDTSFTERASARRHATYLLTTPDMLHYGLLPQHQRWSGFFRRLRFVIVDECHGYRGVFGSHVAQVLRRLRRVAAYHRAGAVRAPPPAVHPRLGDDQRAGQVRRVADRGDGRARSPRNGAPRGPMTFGMWEPPLTATRGVAGAPVRRSAIAEAADAARRPRARRNSGARFHQVKARSRSGGGRREVQADRGRRRRADPPGRRLPVRIPARRAQAARRWPAHRRDHRAGRDARRSSSG